MRDLLCRNTLAALCLALMSVPASAHTTNMTTITLALAEDGSFEMVVQLDPGEKLLGYQRYFEITRMGEIEQARAMAPVTQVLEKELRVAFDGGRVLLQPVGWTLPNAPYETFIDPTVPTMSQVRFRGAAPPRAEKLDFVYAGGLELPTPVLFRVDKAGEKLPFSRVVDGPDLPMRSIVLVKPPPPLLDAKELAGAARVVHGGRATLAAYRRALNLGWQSTWLPWVVCVAVATALMRAGGGPGLMHHVGAGVAAGVAFVAVRAAEGDTSGYGSALGVALAGIVVAVGLAAIRPVPPVQLGALSIAAGALWGMLAVAWLPEPISPVVSRGALALLQGMGYGAAWIALGLLTTAAFSSISSQERLIKRGATALGAMIVAAGCYAVVHAF